MCGHEKGREKQPLGVVHASQHDTLLWLVTGRLQELGAHALCLLYSSWAVLGNHMPVLGCSGSTDLLCITTAAPFPTQDGRAKAS